MTAFSAWPAASSSSPEPVRVSAPTSPAAWPAQVRSWSPPPGDSTGSRASRPSSARTCWRWPAMSLSMQWGRYRVRVNAFAPGFFATEMTAPMTAEGGQPPEWLAARQAIRAAGNADDALGIVTYLLSDASRFVTGQHIAVDGGYTIS